MRSVLVALLGLMLQGCKTVPVDPFPSAFGSDLTLVVSSCSGLPGRGADICRVKEGTAIESVWRVFLPVGKEILGGEVAVFFKDIQKTYSVQPDQILVEVPWSDLVAGGIWKTSDEGTALIVAKLRFKDAQGIERLIRAKGLAILQINPKDYDLMPIDSGFQAWEGTCRVQYSTAGRSAVECK